jgi:prepilin-type processing-associated H-X9-DG protein
VWGDFYRGGWGGTNYLGLSGTDGMIPTVQPTSCSDISADTKSRGLHQGVFFGNSSVRLSDITDGTSQTLFVGERGITLEWGKWGGAGLIGNCPMGITDVVLPGVIGGIDGGLRPALGEVTDRVHWWSWHRGGTNFSLADGSVRFTSYMTDRNLLARLANRSDGEITEF